MSTGPRSHLKRSRTDGGARYAPPAHWDRVFRRLRDAGTDLDWEQEWTGVFAPVLHANRVRRVLDLGCGTGNDVVRLTREGFIAVGLDFSYEAIQQALTKAPSPGMFVVADIAVSLPFRTASLDAVMSNLALHMFDDVVTRRVFADVRRVLRPDGVFVFHVNALEDRPLRARGRPQVRELEPDYILEADGQTMRFFSEPYLRALLTGWRAVQLQLVEILYGRMRGVREILQLVQAADGAADEPRKWVWRGMAIA